jgi:hypothetical protein
MNQERFVIPFFRSSWKNGRGGEWEDTTIIIMTTGQVEEEYIRR